MGNEGTWRELLARDAPSDTLDFGRRRQRWNEGEETLRTWQPGAGAGEVLSGTMGKSKTRDPMEEQADKDADKKAEDDGGEVVQRPWSQLEGLGLTGHSNAL